VRLLFLTSRPVWLHTLTFLFLLPPAFNLLNHIDLTETEARITAFAVANASTISTNQLLLQEEEAAVREREEEERVEREWRREQGRKGKKDEEKEKEKRRLEVLKELVRPVPACSFSSERCRVLLTSRGCSGILLGRPLEDHVFASSPSFNLFRPNLSPSFPPCTQVETEGPFPTVRTSSPLPRPLRLLLFSLQDAAKVCRPSPAAVDVRCKGGVRRWRLAV
jgi:hypothetical protein